MNKILPANFDSYKCQILLTPQNRNPEWCNQTASLDSQRLCVIESYDIGLVIKEHKITNQLTKELHAFKTKQFLEFLPQKSKYTSPIVRRYFSKEFPETKKKVLQHVSDKNIRSNKFQERELFIDKSVVEYKNKKQLKM